MSRSTAAPGSRGTLRGFAAAVVLALVLFFVVGHASHAPMAMGAGGELVHGVGICLLAATVLVPFVLPALPARPLTAATLRPVIEAVAATPQSVPAAARASPAWLQRFRD